MNSTEVSRLASKIHSLGRYLEDGAFFGTLRVTIHGAHPDGSDAYVELPFPYWKNVSSHR
jgi:hypothetical protein